MIIATNNHLDEVGYQTIAYLESLIRSTQAGQVYLDRLNKVDTEDDALVLIAELEKMRLPLAYERVPYTVEEIGYCVKFLADKYDYYERHIASDIR
jgi:sigma54-dependent transcription regulator